MSELIQLAPLAANQKHLLSLFLFYERGKGECWPSSLTLLTRSGLRSRQTLATHKNALRAQGLLSWKKPGEPGNERCCCLYRLHWEQLQALVILHLVSSSQRPSRRSATARRGSPLAIQAANDVTIDHGVALPGEQKTRSLTPSDARTTNDIAAVLKASPRGPLSARSPGAPDEPPAMCPLGAKRSAPPGASIVDDLLDLDEVFGAGPALASAGEKTMPGGPTPHGFFVVGPEDLAFGILHDRSLGLPSETTSSATVTASESDGLDAPDFQVSVQLVWSCWQDAYKRSYGRPYLSIAADRFSAASLASACHAAVLHHIASGSSLPSRIDLAEQFLRHVAQAFLRKPGRGGFLQRMGHPLELLLKDLNTLGTPWPRKSPVAPAPKATPAQGPVQTVEVLAPQQMAVRARGLVAMLDELETLRRRPSPGSAVEK